MTALPAGRHRRTQIIAKQWITTRTIRITVGDTDRDNCSGNLDDLFTVEGLGQLANAPQAGSGTAGFTDAHAAFYFYPSEARVPEEFTAEAIRPLHDFASPQVRRYTVHRVDAMARTVDFDIVVHEPTGLASSWAREVEVGDELLWWGPTLAWECPPGISELLLVGDETALPAIDSILRGLPSQVHAAVIALVTDHLDECYFANSAPHGRTPTDITWVHRNTPSQSSQSPTLPIAPPPDFLRALTKYADRVRDTIPGSVGVWAGLEFSGAAAVRRTFLRDPRPPHYSNAGLSLSKQLATVTSYWIHGQPQDARPDARNRARNLAHRTAFPEAASHYLK